MQLIYAIPDMQRMRYPYLSNTHTLQILVKFTISK